MVVPFYFWWTYYRGKKEVEIVGVEEEEGGEGLLIQDEI